MKKNWRALAASFATGALVIACGRQGAEAPAAEEEAAVAGASSETLIADALSAAPPSLAASVTVADWAGNVLRHGSGGYTCLPTPPSMPPGTSPMCMDANWMEWANAWSNRTPFAARGIGISYMLAGDGGASNTDPFAAGPTEDNEWVVEGPHLMIITPDASVLDALPTDFENGGPYVMWKGTPYAHVMVPVDVGEISEVETPLEDALSAANADMAAHAKVVDWGGNMLQEGGGTYTCMPTPPQLSGRAPMCFDEPWMAWADAWMSDSEFTIDSIGISYMLAGDEGASNIDPKATGPSDDNEWVVEGPHLMIIVPDNGLLAGLPTDPENGGPYVMWRDTPYAHVMVPLGD